MPKTVETYVLGGERNPLTAGRQRKVNALSWAVSGIRSGGSGQVEVTTLSSAVSGSHSQRAYGLRSASCRSCFHEPESSASPRHNRIPLVMGRQGWGLWFETGHLLALVPIRAQMRMHLSA